MFLANVLQQFVNIKWLLGDVQLDLPIFKLRTPICNLDHHRKDAQLKQVTSMPKERVRDNWCNLNQRFKMRLESDLLDVNEKFVAYKITRKTQC